MWGGLSPQPIADKYDASIDRTQTTGRCPSARALRLQMRKDAADENHIGRRRAPLLWGCGKIPQARSAVSAVAHLLLGSYASVAGALNDASIQSLAGNHCRTPQHPSRAALGGRGPHSTSKAAVCQSRSASARKRLAGGKDAGGRLFGNPCAPKWPRGSTPGTANGCAGATRSVGLC